MMWQSPALSLTAQAFLLTIALGAGTAIWARMVAAVLSLLVALASFQLMTKHRYMERSDSKLLHAFETLRRNQGFGEIHQQRRLIAPSLLASWSSYNVWRALLMAFGVSALLVLTYFGLEISIRLAELFSNRNY